MDTLILHGRLGRPAHILGDDSARVRADRTIAIRPGCRDESATPRLAIGLRATIFVVGYPIGGIALVWLSALISALAAGALSAIYMVVVACVILHMAFTSLAENER
jgi:hypothetical protein